MFDAVTVSSAAATNVSASRRRRRWFMGHSLVGPLPLSGRAFKRRLPLLGSAADYGAQKTQKSGNGRKVPDPRDQILRWRRVSFLTQRAAWI
jgi:hypothetical protein